MTLETAQCGDQLDIIWSMKRSMTGCHRLSLESLIGWIHLALSLCTKPHLNYIANRWHRSSIISPLNSLSLTSLPLNADSSWAFIMCHELVFSQRMPLGNLPPWMITNLAPVLASSARGGCAQEEAANDRCAGRPIRIQQQKFHTGVPKALFRRHVEDKELVEDRVWCALLYMSLLLAYTFLALVQIHFHIGIYKDTNEKVKESERILQNWDQ